MSFRFLAALGLAVVLACVPPLEPIPTVPTQLLIQAVLDGNSRFQMISVERTDNGVTGSGAVTGAIVEIVTPSGFSMRADENVTTPDGRAHWNGMYVVDLAKFGVFRIEPRSQYKLNVRLANAVDSATGTTDVPGPDAPIVASRSPFNRETDTLRLSWHPAVGATKYQVTIECAVTVPRVGTTFYKYQVFADTSVEIVGTARTLQNDPVFYPGSSATVTVHAVDNNYYSYYHTTTDPFAGSPPSRLHGALGVFGSMSLIQHTTFRVQ